MLIRWLRRKIKAPVVHDPDGDGEGRWVKATSVFPESATWSWLWTPPRIDANDRCASELCLFGREWIQCKKRRGHSGVHRHSETWAWEVGDERA